ncbi:hypothetical protein XENTR_v10001268 [Xenopus tropicalis]|nr:hypothetical protein XENTR_v10001268 [Xenopus tropicalis]
MWEAVRTGRAVGPAGALEMRDYCDSGRLFHSQCKTCCNSMTLEEITSCDNHKGKMQPVSRALEEVLVAAQKRDSLTVGVYESAKLMNVDPDRVVLCLLAADPEHEDSIALKIHFTLIKAFCCDNDINIVQVSGLQRLSEITDGHLEGNSEPSDLHCILVLVRFFYFSYFFLKGNCY